MTVGITAIADSDDSPTVVAAADRMVTVGEQGGIEFESNESKMTPFVDNGQLAAVAIGAGSTTYVDEILATLDVIIENLDNEPRSVNDMLQLPLIAYKRVIQDTVENQLLAPLGYSLPDLRNGEVRIPVQVQQNVFEQAHDLRQRLSENVHLLVAGVGVDGPGIFILAGGDFTNYTGMGYWVVGSGADSAGLSLIRRQYNHRSSVREAVFTVLEAKQQAEERQGVGQQMDMSIVAPSGIANLDDDEKRELRDLLDDIKDREREARESVMGEWELPTR